MNNNSNEEGIKFGPLWLSRGITKGNVSVMFFMGWASVMIAAFPGIFQPLLMKSMGIDESIQGTLTANIAVLNDVIGILIMTGIGALSDRTGRRIVLLFGFFVISIGIAIFPTAESITQLYLFRIIVAVGMGTIATTMIAVVQDYTQDRSRGTMTGFNSLFSGFGVLFVSLVLLQFPQYFSSIGIDSPTNLIYTCFIASGIAMLAVVIGRLGLSGQLPEPENRTKSMFEGLSDAIAESKRNPRIRLAYIAAFCARGDFAVIGIYFSLWFTHAGSAENMSVEDISAKIGIYFGLLNIAIMIWAPIYGFIIDKINRVTAVCFALTLASLGYTMMGLIDDPFVPAAIIPACIVLGMGEAAAIVSCGSLVGQEAPARIRGSVIGCYALFGTIGILTLTYTSGRLFDAISPTAPFLFMGAVNAIVVIIALYVRLKYPSDATEPTAA